MKGNVEGVLKRHLVRDHESSDKSRDMLSLIGDVNGRVPSDCVDLHRSMLVAFLTAVTKH